jgi:plasmid stabilization system protein ParE
MSAYFLSPEADEDLMEIWSYIARDSARSADRVEQHIREACRMLSTKPHAGRLRPEFTSLPLRVWDVPRYNNYLIVYDSTSSPVRIVRILHGARDLRALLPS